ncbi:hypothetical protein [Bradyrhizobium sp.]|uniref:hypothetical protein n=1 Tax=Bradyrhizobium sp. TaxID=376 RepID=UPI002CE3A9CD|nr:hypothetical protein [Bradyrhizobium sp.]HMM88328.1 hypothetical protein [Bradyrhizobium sp.]
MVRLQALLPFSTYHPCPSTLIGFDQLSLAGLKSVTLGTTFTDMGSEAALVPVVSVAVAVRLWVVSESFGVSNSQIPELFVVTVPRSVDPS